jgi:hypothetical protein
MFTCTSEQRLRPRRVDGRWAPKGVGSQWCNRLDCATYEEEVAFMKRFVLVVMVALVMALILAVGGASAKPEAISVQVGPTAQIDEGPAGNALLVTVEVACEQGFEVLEANVFAQQGATSNFGGSRWRNAMANLSCTRLG